MLENKSLDSLHGSVERVTFHSDITGFCVLKVHVKGHKDPIAVIGSTPSIAVGESIECKGRWVRDKKYGLQFRFEQLKQIQPTTLEGIEKYLGSGMIRGIGPHFARKLVRAFGADVFEVIEHHPDRLMDLEGIGSKRKEQVQSAWDEQKVVRDIMVFLQSHGVGTRRAVRIYKTYGDHAVAKVTENPYRLAADIYGIGFKTADELAVQLGIPRNSEIRARAGLSFVLHNFSNDGHCAVPKDTLIEKARELLEIDVDIISNAINAELKTKNIILASIHDVECLFLASLYQAEEGVAKHIKRLNTGSVPWGNMECTQVMSWVAQKTGVQLGATQQDAVKLALAKKVLVITGGPGVGKTTIINSIIKIVRTKGVAIGLCAPTGRAAKRMSETTGCDAKTIHRLLEFDPQKFNFKYNNYNPLPLDLVVLDEASMVDVSLMYSLLKAIPSHAALIMVGDVDQLPSVGPGKILEDIINSNFIATIKLTKIFRQAASSKIITNAHKIKLGHMPIIESQSESCSDFYFIPADTPEAIHDKLIKVVKERIPAKFNLDPVNDIQVLTPMNRGGLGSQALNIALQQALNPSAEPKVKRFGWVFTPGDKVIQNINNYDKEVFNGDIGIVQQVDLHENILRVNFEDRYISYDFNELDELSLAYATSIHKSQGSEYKAVVIPIAMQHYMMLVRNLLYTGVTRGKTLVVIIGQQKALAMAVRNVRQTTRLTNLQAKLFSA
jgi:exodeoxyribonuclease V alpha subunit